MPNYEIKARVGFDTYTRTVKAKNSTEAHYMALKLGHEKSQGGKRFLHSVNCKRIYEKKTYKR